MIFGKFTAIAGACSIVALCPFAIGKVAQTIYEREITNFKSPNFSLVSSEFERGYLTSSVITEVNLKGPLLHARIAKGEPTSFLVKTVLEHGIVSLEGQSELVWNKEQLKQTDRELAPVRANFEVNMLGNVNYVIKTTPFQSTFNELEFQTSRADIKGKYNLNGELSFVLELPDLFIKKNNDKLNFEQLTLDVAVNLEEQLWIGKQSMSSYQVNFASDVNPNWQLRNSQINLQTQLGKNNEDIDNTNKWKVNTLVSATAQQLISDFDNLQAKNLNLAVNLLNFDYNSMIKLSNVNKIKNGHASIRAEKAFDQLINKGFKVNIPLTFDVEQGPIEGLVDLAIDKGTMSASQNLMDLLDNFRGEISLHFPTVFVDTQNDIIKIIEQEGFLIQTDKDMELNFSVLGDEIISSTGTKVSYQQMLALLF